MACMEHFCECGFSTMNNISAMSCPKCGSSCRSYFDEEDDHHYEDNRGDWDEDEEDEDE